LRVVEGEFIPIKKSWIGHWVLVYYERATLKSRITPAIEAGAKTLNAGTCYRGPVAEWFLDLGFAG